MRDFVKEQSAGELLRNAASIYLGHWSAIVLPYLILVLPLNLVQWRATLDGNTTLVWLTIIANLPFAFLAYGAIVVSISEACLGSTPSAIRSLRKALTGMFWRLAVVSLLQTVVFLVGLVLLVIPGLLFAVWFAFAPVAVVLDEASGTGALKRSKELATGHHWRTAGVLALLVVVFAALGGILGGIMGAIEVTLEAYTLVLTLLQLLLYPTIMVVLVLMYYDLRVRKEGYNMAALEQDLAR
jgi:hypothetical protein